MAVDGKLPATDGLTSAVIIVVTIAIKPLQEIWNIYACLGLLLKSRPAIELEGRPVERFAINAL